MNWIIHLMARLLGRQNQRIAVETQLYHNTPEPVPVKHIDPNAQRDGAGRREFLRQREHWIKIIQQLERGDK